MMKRVVLCLALVLVVMTLGAAAALAADAPKGHPAGCASCHVAHEAQGARLWPYAPNAKTEKGTPLSLGSALCYSCHDGTITAMGAGFFEKDGSTHPIDVVASKRVSIPKDFPVDPDGKMTCATCHDPHNKKGVAIKSYLRLTDEDGSLCQACHVNN